MNRLLDPVPETTSKTTPTSNGTNSHADPAKAKAAPKNGRQANGQFAPDNPGGPGNPFARLTAALRRALVQSVTEADIQQIATKLLQQAKKGDVPSARLLFSYAIGHPTPAPDPDTLDHAEWQVLQRQQARLSDVNEFLRMVPAEDVCHVMGIVKPALGMRFRDTIFDYFVKKGWPEFTRHVQPATPAKGEKKSTRAQRREKKRQKRE
jgi:hypothetical protein